MLRQTEVPTALVTSGDGVDQNFVSGDDDETTFAIILDPESFGDAGASHSRVRHRRQHRNDENDDEATFKPWKYSEKKSRAQVHSYTILINT
jgi:hypothetical protein